MGPGADGPLGFEPDAGRDTEAAPRREPAGAAPARAAEGPSRLAAGAHRYGWWIGVAGVVLVLLITANTFRSASSGPGSRGVPAGEPAPPFAAPLATGDVEGDVNVAVRAGQGAAGSVPACSVQGPGVLNACALWARGPAVLAFVATRGAGCVRQLDRLDAVAARHPRVRFAAVSIRGDRDDLRRTIRARGWRFPVGFDADGVLANLYGVAVCPQIAYVRRGGRVAATSFGELSVASLDARVARLER